jgi:hypothetical protein
MSAFQIRSRPTAHRHSAGASATYGHRRQSRVGALAVRAVAQDRNRRPCNVRRWSGPATGTGAPAPGLAGMVVRRHHACPLVRLGRASARTPAGTRHIPMHQDTCGRCRQKRAMTPYNSGGGRTSRVTAPRHQGVSGFNRRKLAMTPLYDSGRAPGPRGRANTSCTRSLQARPGRACGNLMNRRWRAVARVFAQRPYTPDREARRSAGPTPLAARKRVVRKPPRGALPHRTWKIGTASHAT